MTSLVAIGYVLLAALQAAPQPELVSVQRIWDAAPHNAFTDLVRWNDAWYCTFREGDGHVGGDGKTRVITSADGVKWESVALMEEAGVDLRDPKLSVTPDNRLMALMGGSIYREGKLVGMQPRVAFSKDGKAWGPTQPILKDGDWLWRVTWHKGTAYGVSYGVGADGVSAGAKLVKSSDGVQWDLVSSMGTDKECNEATLRFQDDDTCIALIRRDGGDKQGWIGQSKAPYTEWNWTPCGHALGGPEFIMVPDKGLWAGSRDVRKGATTVVASMTPTTYKPLLTLPSGGDCSYPGMVWHDNEIWMAYYSSHEEKTAIYLARIALK